MPSFSLSRFGMLLALSLLLPRAFAQDLYFPPATGSWERVAPATVGWDETGLMAALTLAGKRHSSGVLVLHRGRILAEQYWSPADPPQAYLNSITGHDAAGHVIEDVASAQKSVVAVITGMAQERGLLSIDDSVSTFLGPGWSRLDAAREAAITLRHLLTMTSGLADDLSFEATPGARWRYNTPAYHMVMRAVLAAVGTDRDTLTRDWITAPLGMHDSSWTARPWASAAIGVGFSTTARDLARFGLMLQAGGRWQDRVIIQDSKYLQAMLQPSQSLNPSYGYLWWLNGQEFTLRPNAGARRVPGSLITTAPADLVAMQGALDRKLYLVPSLDLVVARLGYGGEAGGESFNEAFWRALMAAAPGSH